MEELHCWQARDVDGAHRLHILVLILLLLSPVHVSVNPVVVADAAAAMVDTTWHCPANPAGIRKLLSAAGARVLPDRQALGDTRLALAVQRHIPRYGLVDRIGALARIDSGGRVGVVDVWVSPGMGGRGYGVPSRNYLLVDETGWLAGRHVVGWGIAGEGGGSGGHVDIKFLSE